MKHIITVQHTQSVHHTNGMVGSWTDWDLTELGKSQADHIGKKLKDELLGKKVIIYSSDLKRAKQTADEIAKYLGVEPILKLELRERNLGKCCGKSVQWLRENIECPEKTVDDIHGCATAQNRNTEEGAWLGPDIIKAYTELHRQGFAASVEVWEKQADGDRLVGGLYGVNLGSSFFGESMFSLVPNASKLALIHLARMFEILGGHMIDCQFETPHLRSMGGRYIPYDEYIAIIRKK